MSPELIDPENTMAYTNSSDQAATPLIPLNKESLESWKGTVGSNEVRWVGSSGFKAKPGGDDAAFSFNKVELMSKFLREMNRKKELEVE